MALTTAAALKVLIEGLGLGLAAYRDEPPQTTPRPYVTIQEEIALVTDGLEDAGPSTVMETVQVDLWQDWKVLAAGPAMGSITESYTLAPALRRGIHGQRLVKIGSALVYMVRVASTIRFLEPAENIVHHALTCEVNREL